jgi:hypothetical protein
LSFFTLYTASAHGDPWKFSARGRTASRKEVSTYGGKQLAGQYV